MAVNESSMLAVNESSMLAANENSMMVVNESSMMAVNESSMLATMDPFCLLCGCASVCILAWYCAKRYKITNDFKKSVHLYVPSVIVLDFVLALALDIDALLCIGMDVFGFVALALISNHYFYN